MKLRDELAEKVNKHFEKIGANTDDVFKYGFGVCEAHYLPMLEKLESALKKNIVYIDSIWNFTKQVEIENTCRKQKHFSQQALAELAEFKKQMNGEN